MKKKGWLKEKSVYEKRRVDLKRRMFYDEEGLTKREELLWRRGWLKEKSFYEEEGLTQREEVFMTKKGWLQGQSFYEEEELEGLT